MKKIIFSAVFALIIVPSLASAATLNVVSNPTDASYSNAVVKTADRLVAIQGTNGGWDWIVTGQTSAAASTYLNVTGVTAEALLSAYALTGNSVYLEAAKKAGDYIVTSIDASSPKSINGYNVLFLKHLSTASGVQSYADKATEYFGTLYSSTSTTLCASGCVDTNGLYAGYLAKRSWSTSTPSGIVAWDLVPLVEYANLVGDSAHANEVESVIVSNLSVATTTMGNYDLGIISGFKAASLVGDATNKALFSGLLVTSDGSYGTDSDGKVQATAYALKAFNQAGDSRSTASANYLANAFSPTVNGWIETDNNEYAEVDGEAAQALASALPQEVRYYTLSSALNAAATAGDTITLGAGTYVGDVLLNKSLTFTGNTGAIVQGKITVATDTVTVSGVTVTNPIVGYGIYVNNVSHITLTNNNLTNIGTDSSYTSGTAQAIYVQGSGAGASDITITGNTVNGVGNTGLLNGSVKGIYIGDSNGVNNISGVIISNNAISNIKTSPASAGKGAYGIHVNHSTSATSGVSTTGLQITNNTISDLSGKWGHGIALEGNTPSAIVTGNSISHVVSSGVDSVGVQFEDNAGATSVTFTGNSIDTASVKYGVMNVATTTPVEVSHNYWATTTPDNIKGGAANMSPWYINPGRTTLNTDISGSGTTVTVTAPKVDFEETTDGGVTLPNGVSELTLSNTSVLDFASSTNEKSGTDIMIGGATTSLSTFVVSGATSTVDLSVAQTVGGESVTIGKAVTLSSGSSTQPIVLTNSAVSNVSVSIPDSTTILAPSGWDGTIAPPKSVASSGSGPSGFSVGNTVISVGSTDTVLIFDKPVTLTLTGVTGNVGYKSAGSNQWVTIGTTCTGTYANPTGAVFPGECKITDGTNTKILTYHFTTFGGLSVLPPEMGGVYSSGGGSGGVSNSGSSNTPTPSVTTNVTPAAPAGQVLGASTENTPKGMVLGATAFNFMKDLKMGAKGEDVTELQKVLIADGFLNSEATGFFGSLTKNSLAKWQAKNNLPATGFFGPMTRKLLSENTGVSSNASVQGVTHAAFSRDLKLGSKGDDVTELQKMLIGEGFFNSEATGYFGSLTKSSLAKWQAKKGVSATGYFGPTSRATAAK